MSASRESASSIRDEDLIAMFSRHLPELLERRPDLEPVLFHVFLKTFARRDEVALVVTELRAMRTEMERRFEQVDESIEQVDKRIEQVDKRIEESDKRFERFRAEVDARFNKVETRMDAGFDRLDRSIDRLGSRWGIRSESVFRRTIATLLEESFGVGVEQRTIAGEQFDVVIHDHQHVLVEIAASAGRTMQSRLERKRRLYEESTGVRPARVILATADIRSYRAEQLRQAGIEVIEPEDDDPPE